MRYLGDDGEVRQSWQNGWATCTDRGQHKPLRLRQLYGSRFEWPDGRVSENVAAGPHDGRSKDAPFFTADRDAIWVKGFRRGDVAAHWADIGYLDALADEAGLGPGSPAKARLRTSERFRCPICRRDVKLTRVRLQQVIEALRGSDRDTPFVIDLSLLPC